MGGLSLLSAYVVCWSRVGHVSQPETDRAVGHCLAKLAARYRGASCYARAARWRELCRQIVEATWRRVGAVILSFESSARVPGYVRVSYASARHSPRYKELETIVFDVVGRPNHFQV